MRSELAVENIDGKASDSILRCFVGEQRKRQLLRNLGGQAIQAALALFNSIDRAEAFLGRLLR